MTSFKLIFRNVHKNIRDYLIYFLTLTLSVSLFYAFNSISDQPAFSDMGITGSLLYDQLGILLSALSVVIAVVLAFLIIYANQFLLKRRKKELGVYMVLGMKKRRISRLFAGETLCVGVIALVSGLVLGLLFSQGLSLVALKLFAIGLDKFQIVFSAGAFRQTVLCFVIIFFIVMLFNVWSVTNVKLIDLLTASRKNESIKAVVTQSLDEEKWVNRVTRTDFNVYNSAAFNVMESVQHHKDTLSQQAVDLIAGQPGVEDERYLYRNTKDDRNVLVDYGFEDLSGIELFHEEEGVVNQSYQGYSLYTSSDTERRYFGNVMGASENFWADMRIFEGEKDAETLTQKMATGEYVIIGCPMDKLTEEPRNTPLTDQLQVGESISFYKDGELVKTSTILAKAILVGTETETPTGTTAQAHIAADAPFVYLPDTVFKEIYDAPTLLTYGFNVDEALQPQMEEFLSSYVSENTSVAYTSTKLLKEQLDSVRSMILVIGGLIGCIMAFAGLINFANMIITNIITRRHEFATMQSIGMTGKQLRRLTVYEGIYYAVGADIIGGAVAAILAVTVLKSALNGPSMWFFTLNITLVPVLVIGVLYLLLAAVIPLIVLHFFNKGTVVERLRTSE